MRLRFVRPAQHTRFFILLEISGNGAFLGYIRVLYLNLLVPYELRFKIKDSFDVYLSLTHGRGLGWVGNGSRHLSGGL